MDGAHVGPSKEYVRLLNGEITADEYVRSLQDRVDKMRDQFDKIERSERRRKMLAAKIYATLERTARTFVQGFLGVVTADALNGGLSVTLVEALEAGALAGAYAVLMAFAFPPRASAAPAE